MNILTILQILLKDLRKKSKKSDLFSVLGFENRSVFLYCLAGQESTYSVFGVYDGNLQTVGLR